MANRRHLELLKQGVEVWNLWRVENPEIQPNLKKVDLRNADLNGADFSGTNLSEVNLSRAKMTNTNLRRAILIGTIFFGANLTNADFSEAEIGSTIFANNDLSRVRGLDSIYHFEASSIDIDTIYRSQGKIPEVFLRGAGIPDTFITYIDSLTGRATQYYSCFISYSSKDEAFAARLHADLQAVGIRCWFAPEDMRVGDKIMPRIDEAIRLHDKLLLVLSKNTLASDWVEKEVVTAFEEERNQTVLFPVRLDETVMNVDQAWAADIRRTRHIGDFTHWNDYDSYQKSLSRLVRDLTFTVVAESNEQERA